MHPKGPDAGQGDRPGVGVADPDRGLGALGVLVADPERTCPVRALLPEPGVPDLLPGPSLSGCVETPRSPGVTREGVTGDSLVSSNSPGLPGAGDHLAAGSIEAVPDPAARPVRRSFTAAYRARVVAEYEAAPRGSKAAVLRREGLYQSQIREWTIARDALTRGAAAPRRAHRATVSGGKDDPGRLRAENQRLTPAA